MDNKIIILKIAFIINKELYDENKITYQIYKCVETRILKEIGNE